MDPDDLDADGLGEVDRDDYLDASAFDEQALADVLNDMAVDLAPTLEDSLIDTSDDFTDL